MKKELKIKAKKLRAQGYSIKELHTILGVSKSTISRWSQDIILSVNAKNRLRKNYTNGQLASQKTIQNKTIEKNTHADNFAKNIVGTLDLSDRSAVVFCAIVYQCEGSKSIQDAITFTNSDPALIKTFLYLLRKSFHLDEKKFRVLMHLHEYHNEKSQKEFWSTVTMIPTNQFLKTYHKKNTGLYKKENYQGCIQIRYRDVVIGRNLHAVAKIFMERYK